MLREEYKNKLVEKIKGISIKNGELNWIQRQKIDFWVEALYPLGKNNAIDTNEKNIKAEVLFEIEKEIGISLAGLTGYMKK